MKRGIRSAKSPKQTDTKGLGKAAAQIVGIGLVAGTALVLGTDKIMSKIFKKDEADAECEEEAESEGCDAE